MADVEAVSHGEWLNGFPGGEMNVVAGILAVGTGSGQRLTPRDAGVLSGILVVAALWILSNLWRPPETRWRWGKHGLGRVPASNFGVIVSSLTLLCVSGYVLAIGFGATATANAFMAMFCLGLALNIAAAFHDYACAAAGRSPTPPEPPPATPDKPPDDSNA